MFLEKAEQIASCSIKNFRKKNKKLNRTGEDDESSGSYPHLPKHLGKSQKSKHNSLFNRLRRRSINDDGSSTNSSPNSTLNQSHRSRWNSVQSLKAILGHNDIPSDSETRSSTLTDQPKIHYRSNSSSKSSSITRHEDALRGSINSTSTVGKRPQELNGRAGEIRDSRRRIRNASSDYSQSRGSTTTTCSFPSATVDDTASSRTTDRLIGDLPTLDKEVSRLLPREGFLWSLKLYLKCGRNLSTRGIQGKADSYVKLKYRGKRIRRTKTVFNDRNPVYDQTVVFIVNNLGYPIELRVYNQDMFKKDDYVGRVVMPLKHLALHQMQEFTVRLTNENSQDSGFPVGELIFSLTLGETPVLEVDSERRQYLLKQLKIDRQSTYQYPALVRRTSPDLLPIGYDVSSWCEKAARLNADSNLELNHIYNAIEDDELENDDWLDENEFQFRQPTWPACFYDGTKLEVYTGRLPNKLQSLPFSQISRLPRAVTDVNWEQMYTRSKLVVSLIGAQNLGKNRKTSTVAQVVHRVMSKKSSSVTAPPLGKDTTEAPAPMAILNVGKTTFRSSVIKNTRNPSWHQEFEFRLKTGDKKILQVEIRDMSTNSHTTLARAYLDFAKLMPDWTDCFTLKNVIEGQEGQVILLATLTGFSKPPSDAGFVSPNIRLSQTSIRSPEPLEDGLVVPPSQPPVCAELLNLVAQQFSLRNTLKDRMDVGWLHVFVIGARQLRAADSNGKSDPYCTIRLVNRVACTSTIYKTLDPTWNQSFVFPIGDIYSVLDITVWDEDKEKADFLGKLQIPLTQITSNRKRWYALKDKDMKKLSKGSICLEAYLEYNPIRAALRAAYPREEPCIWHEHRVKLRTLVQKYVPNLQIHITRITNYTPPLEMGTQMLKKLYSWENPTYSTLFIIALCFAILYIQPYMIAFGMTLGLTVVRLSQVKWFHRNTKMKRSPSSPLMENDDIELEETLEYLEDISDYSSDEALLSKSKHDKKKPLKQKLQKARHVMGMIEQAVEGIASLLEKFESICKWQVPWLSFLVVLFTLVVGILTFFIPLRYLLILYVIKRFTKRLRRAQVYDASPLSFILRVPNRVERIQYRQIKPSDSPARGND